MHNYKLIRSNQGGNIMLCLVQCQTVTCFSVVSSHYCICFYCRTNQYISCFYCQLAVEISPYFQLFPHFDKETNTLFLSLLSFLIGVLFLSAFTVQLLKGCLFYFYVLNNSFTAQISLPGYSSTFPISYFTLFIPIILVICKLLVY